MKPMPRTTGVSRRGKQLTAGRDPPRPSPRRWLRSKVTSAAAHLPIPTQPPLLMFLTGKRYGGGEEREGAGFPAYRPYYRAYLLQKGSRLM